MIGEKIHLHLTFTEPVLGSRSGDPKLVTEFIASKAQSTEKAKEEIELTPEQLEENIEKGSTIFPKDDIGLFMWDYQVRGFIKESIAVLIELGEITSVSKWVCKRAVDSFVFVNPRRIYFKDAAGIIIKGTNETLERPLRCTTMRGERVALARSEMLPPGTNCGFEINLLVSSNKKAKTLSREDIMSAIDYGRLKGMLQWRSGGYGRFEYKDLSEATA